MENTKLQLEPIDPAVIEHYRNLSYGLFIHMGLYSVLGGSYQGQPTPFYSEWIRHTLNIPAADYHKLIDQFQPDQFIACEIVSQAKAWGMTYLCFTAKHHDGFAMYDSQVDDFNSQKHLGRDFVAELAKACQDQGVMLCLYYSQAQDWEHPGGLRAYQDKPAEADYQDYLHNKALPQIRELLTNYGPIGLLWLDTPTGMSQADCLTIARLIRSLQPDCLIGGRIGHGLGDVMITGDNRMPRLALNKAWELPATLNHSWGFSKHDDNWRTADDVIQQLAAVISRGGNLLLNVGPDGQGRIPLESRRVLDQVGDYLASHGEAFYTSRTTPDYPYEQSDFWLTTTPGKLYIHVRQVPVGGRIELYHLENQVKSAQDLASHQPVDFYVGQDLEGHAYWRLTVPNAKVGDIIVVELFEPEVSISSI